MGALDVMLSTTDGMQSNKGALDKLAADMQVNRHSIYKLGKETDATGNLPPHPAEWRQQAAAVDKKGFSGSCRNTLETARTQDEMECETQALRAPSLKEVLSTARRVAQLSTAKTGRVRRGAPFLIREFKRKTWQA